MQFESLSGPVDSWSDGAQGWVLWVAIGLMLGEALATFVLSFFKEMDIVIEALTPKSKNRYISEGEAHRRAWAINRQSIGNQ